MNNIRDIVRRLAQQDPGSMNGSIMVCKVTDVDKDARTVDVEPLNEDAPILGVNLQANQESKVGVVQIPRKDSYVVVGLMGVAGVVLLCDDVESVEVAVKDMSIDVTEDGIVMNGGELGGMVKVENLTSRLNAIEDEINNLKTAITNAPVSPMDGGAAFKGGLSAWAGAQMVKSKRGDYENENVKQ